MDKTSIDAYTPAEMALRVRDVGVAKANLDFPSMLGLAVLAGAFIAMGACFSTLTVTGIDLGYGLNRLLAGLTFSMGLIFVIVAGAELFTGNNLIIMAWASGLLPASRLLRNWTIVYLGNLVGAVGTAALVFAAGTWMQANQEVGVTALKIAAAKTSLPWLQAFFLGILCNALVCLAVWLCFSARTTTDKILSIVFPITAFVALGFEHSVANMYFIPLGMMLQENASLVDAANLSSQSLANLGVSGFLRNLLPVTLGNMVGGGVLVAGIYWFIYLRGK